ncbi:MAG: NAD-dependent epimerase/dehydratase family protein [Kofleriaceae bacterium]
MQVLVTGAAGFIGSHTCERLVANGHHVLGVDSFDSYLYPAEVKRANAAELARLPAARFRLVTADICDRVAMASVLTGDLDVVCHLAALAGVRPSLVEPLRYLRTNIEGTGVIIERMREVGLQRLVFASSSSVYGAKAGSDLRAVAAFREDDTCLTPASPYAATKRMNELQLSAYRDLYGLGVFALRFFTVYGPRQRPDMAIPKFTHAIARGAPITLYGDGESRRDYTFIEDIVSGTVAAIERVEPGSYEIFNLGGTATISLKDLVHTIEQVVGKQATIEWQPDQPGDVPVTYANIDRARARLDYAPTTRPDAGLQRYWEWLQSARAAS